MKPYMYIRNADMFVAKTNYEHNKKVKDIMCLHLPEFCNKETNYLRNAVSLK